MLYDRLIPIRASDAASANSTAASSAANSTMPSRAPSRAVSRAGTMDSSQQGSQLSPPSKAELSRELSKLGRGLGAGKAVIEVERRDKLDLVKDSRPRYVSPDLLPAVHTLSLVERMSREEAERQKLLLRKKQGLATEHGVAAARSLMEEAIGQSAESPAGMEVGNEPSITGVDSGAVKRKLAV